MKTIIHVLLFILFSNLTVFGQGYKWKLENKYNNTNIEAWDITPLEELIVSSQGSLYKLDTNFNVAFTQSKKSLGLITKIDARHSLKTMIYSVSHQIIEFVDNTLSYQDGNIDLSELNIGYGSHICYSDQTSRFWVFDEQNARLVRFEGLKSSVAQSEVSNLMSITYNDNPTSLMESQNQLFLFYQTGGIFVFDYYGSLLRKYTSPNAIQIYPSENYLYILEDKSIVRIDRKTAHKETITLPMKGIEDLRVFGNSVYFKDRSGVSKYSLIPTK